MCLIVYFAVIPFLVGKNDEGYYYYLAPVDYYVYPVTSMKMFWFTHILQVHVTTCIGLGSLMIDIICVNCLQHVVTQLAIIRSRIQEIPFLDEDQQYRAIVDCVIHHNIVLKYQSFRNNLLVKTSVSLFILLKFFYFNNFFLLLELLQMWRICLPCQ